MPATQTITELQQQLANLESPTSATAAAGPKGYPSSQPVKATATANFQAAAKAALKKTLGSEAPGWIILGLGVFGYVMSETRIVGPLFTILLMVGVIFQLNAYTNRAGSFFSKILAIPKGSFGQ